MKSRFRPGNAVDVNRTSRSSYASPKSSAEAAKTSEASRQRNLLLETLLQTGMRLQTTLNKRFLKLGLTMLDATVVLRCLEMPSGATPGKLAAGLSRDKGLITHVIDRLQKNGFVVRAAGRHDKRITFIKPTDKAKELAPALKALFVGIHQQLFEETLESELDQLLHLLARLRQNSERASP
jgi:DNA-binding MarR family transcriptional regulator